VVWVKRCMECGVEGAGPRVDQGGLREIGGTVGHVGGCRDLDGWRRRIGDD